MRAAILAAAAVLLAGCSQAVSTPAPKAQLTWQDFHGVRLPLSSADGPHTLKNDRAEGFARTRQGALLAALHIAVRANAQWGPDVFEPTITRQVTGSDAAQLLDKTRKQYEESRQEAGLPERSTLGQAYVTEEAYRWESYSPDAATVDIVSAGPSAAGTTVRASTRVQLVWRDGDWRVIAPLGGDWGNAASELKQLDGYTMFGG
ncbi:hypothetical protein [Microtetraspora sp. NBRC 16547]|uniref:hypothetical protein n=1 Tax=Microtetraspora sp. NBRC 16547 TaxID=3030993 RepID=UPI0024A304F1|nr:hypothetical protein [Microtetraspora sp. NBRC 16547]GLW98899.1 hypothetical protein Misp02_29860 [Microtetraspora sp. NBRC 16547]